MTNQKEIFKSLAIVNEELNAIKKDQQGYNYKFRGINQVMNAISPLFKQEQILVSKRVLDSKHDVRYSNETTDKFDKGVKVAEITKEKTNRWCYYRALYIFTSMKDGSTFEVEGYGEAEDGGDKGTGKAISNAYKYVIFEMFNIPTEEQKDSDMDIKEENNVTLVNVEKNIVSVKSDKVEWEAVGYGLAHKDKLAELGFRGVKTNETYTAKDGKVKNKYINIATLDRNTVFPELPGITFKIR